MLFKKANFFTRQCFSIQNFTYNTQKTYLFDTSCYFCYLPAISLLPLPHFAITCNLKSKIQLTLTFSSPVTLQRTSQETYTFFSGFMILMIDSYFSQNVVLFSCHPNVQFCLGGPGFSSHTVRSLFPCRLSSKLWPISWHGFRV